MRPKSGTNHSGRNGSLQSLAMFFAIAATTNACQAESAYFFELIHEFEQSGEQPSSPLVKHSNGNYYGTTSSGGTFDQGTVYRLTPQDTIETLYSFRGIDGAVPNGVLAEGQTGDLYGSASQGGTEGFGVLFKISPSGEFEKLVDFTGQAGPAIGSVPDSLVFHSDGNFYGIAKSGGSSANGVFFQLSPNGSFTHLFSFTGASGSHPGGEPTGHLRSSGEFIYGVTRVGGADDFGTIYSYSTSGQFKLLSSFNGVDGRHPAGGLTESNGLMYGTTEFGGDNDVGVIYSIDEQSGNAHETIHHFSDATGSQPRGPMAAQLDGALRGTTSRGGANGWGGAFSLSPDYTYNPTFDFTGEFGAFPGASAKGGLALASDGSVVGTTSAGGPGQRGVAFRIAADQFELIDDFSNPEGWSPSGAPVPDSEGNLLFPLAEGGVHGLGAVGRIAPDGTYSTATSFTPNSGGGPVGAFIGKGSDLIAVTTLGGSLGRGSIAIVRPNGQIAGLVDFTSAAGELLSGPLFERSNGELIGTAEIGGLANLGVAYRVDNQDLLSRLFSFSGTSGTRLGSEPQNPLTEDSNGVLYGLTRSGGASDQGTLYRINPDGSSTVLHSFEETGPHFPQGGLARASNGKFYGTTSSGGTNGDGVIFEFDPALDQLTSIINLSDLGASLPQGNVTLGADGLLYGLTTGGGDGFGIAYRFSPNGESEILTSFTDANGSRPAPVPYEWQSQSVISGGLYATADGRIYGVSPSGGSKGGGVLFSLSSDSPYTSWKKDFFGDADITDDGDTDGDGLANLVEYALGGNPLVPDAADQAVFSFRNNGQETSMLVLISRDPNRSDITLILESNDDLIGPWTELARSEMGRPFTGSAIILEDSDSAPPVAVTLQVPLETQVGSSLFMRIRVQN